MLLIYGVDNRTKVCYTIPRMWSGTSARFSGQEATMTHIEKERKNALRTDRVFLALGCAGLLMIIFSIACPAKVHAQEQSAPPTTGHVLADAAMPSNVVMNAFIACMASKMAKEKTCKQLADREAERSEKVAKEARKASQPSNPCGGWNPMAGCMYQPIGGYGYGYGPAPGAYQPQRRQPAYGANTQQPRTQTGTAVPRPRR